MLRQLGQKPRPSAALRYICKALSPTPIKFAALIIAAYPVAVIGLHDDQVFVEAKEMTVHNSVC
jgi:hypothetical protein